MATRQIRAVQHPLETHREARAYFERVAARASKGGVCVWRQCVETLTGGLPSWAERKLPARGAKTVVQKLERTAD